MRIASVGENISLRHQDSVGGVAAGAFTRLVECKHGRNDGIICTG
jgi:hypothetical protein